MKNLIPYQINAGGRLMDLSTPKIMGILNVTPDSFFDQSRKTTEREIAQRVEQILSEGGDIIDVGAYSTRPGALDVSPKEEMERLSPALDIIRRIDSDAVISIDTFRSDVARRCVEDYGAHIINDISGGEMDEAMFRTVADLGVPYVLMHMRGTPSTMSGMTDYDNIVKDVTLYLARRVELLRELGHKDIILDPGFGFAKDLDGNYRLMSSVSNLRQLDLPILIGVSRKSMIYKLLGTDAGQALNGTTALHTFCIMEGAANILRVHDVAACREVIEITEKLKANA